MKTNKSGKILGAIAGLAALAGTTTGCAGLSTKTVDKANKNPALEWIADSTGNQNGYAGDQEKDYLGMKLAKSENLYIITMGPGMNFQPWAHDSQIYTSEKEIRDSYKGIGIRGQVGILRLNREGQITGAWSTWGYLSDNQWKSESIPSIDYPKNMRERREREIERYRLTRNL